MWSGLFQGPELLNKYIGASEQAVRDTFTRFGIVNNRTKILVLSVIDYLLAVLSYDFRARYIVEKECVLQGSKCKDILLKRNVFYRAQSAKPSIIFFDEFDALAPR